MNVQGPPCTTFALPDRIPLKKHIVCWARDPKRVQFKESGPLYSTKNADFTKELQCKVDFFVKTENSKNPDVQARKTKFETTFS